MLHKEGKLIIKVAIILAIIIADFTYFLLKNLEWLQYIIYTLLVIMIAMVFYLFRNPKRITKLSDNHVVAPTDGKVTLIKEVYESEYFKDNRLKVSILMSVLDTHVTRYPLSGTIKLSKNLIKDQSMKSSQKTSIVIKNEIFGEVFYQQVAGSLTNHIINYAVEGKNIEQGTDAGFMKIGYRVDLFLPLNSKINVSLGQKVKGAEDIIASL